MRSRLSSICVTAIGCSYSLSCSRRYLGPTLLRATSTMSTPETQDAIDRNEALGSTEQPSGVKGNKKRTHQPRGRARPDKRKHYTRRDEDDEAEEVGTRDPNPGSYAHPSQQELLGIKPQGGREIFGEDEQPLTKKKVAVALGFLGTKYGGFQTNPGQRTLQAEIELALFRGGMMRESNFGYPHKVSWSSSARTDKGVHACAQVCSVKVEYPSKWTPDEDDKIAERIQSFLPDDIQVIKAVRVVKGFCAKNCRDKARYQYMFPSFLLHESPRQLFVECGIPLDGRQPVAKAPLTETEVAALREKLNSYRSSSKQRNDIQTNLSQYVGTHSFHNFTKGIAMGEGTAQRYIMAFEVQDPILVDGIEWIPTRVTGQSFLLHQIRKMVSLAIDVARLPNLEVDVIQRALQEKHFRVSLAPAQGLFLEYSWFERYNRRKKQQNPSLPDLDWSDPNSEAYNLWESMRTRIREHLVKEEAEQGNFIQYLYLQECIFEHERFYHGEVTGSLEDRETAQGTPQSRQTLNGGS